MSTSATARPLRVLYVVEAAAAGVGRHTLDLAEQVAQSGHEVHVVYSPVRMDRTFWHTVQRLRQSALEITLVPLAIRRNVRPSDFRAAVAIRSYARAHGPFDIIHSHSTKAGALVRPCVLGCPGVRIYTPNAFASMDSSAVRMERWAAGRFETTLSRITDGIITVSREEYQHALQIGIPPSKLFLVRNGIHLTDSAGAIAARLEARRRIGLSEDATVLGFVGRFFPQKAPQVLLDAFAQLLPALPQRVCLAMVGEGPLAGELRAVAARLSLGNRVLWLGEMDGPKVMAAFDVFAVSSHYEGFPYVILEAMAASLPVVSTRVGGCSELVIDGENGYVVPPGQPRQLAEALRPLLLDRDLRARMGQKSRERVAEFTVERMAAETMHVYRLLARFKKFSTH